MLRAAAYGAVGPGSGGELGRGGLDAGGAGWRRGGDVRAAPDRRETAPTPSIGPSAGATGTGIWRRTHELGEVRTGDSGRGARMARVLTSGRHMRGPRGGRWQCLGWRPAGGSTDPDPHAPKRRVGVRTRARLAHGGNRPTSARFPAPAGTRAEPLMAPRGRSGLRSKGVCPEPIRKRKQIGASANEAPPSDAHPRAVEPVPGFEGTAGPPVP